MVPDSQLKTTLSSKIANILRQEIYENAIKVGEHLNEVTIASRFGISRGPLRESIRILESEGLVKTPANGRTVVIGFSAKEVVEYYNIRYYLESEAIKKILSDPEDKSYYSWIQDLEKLLNESKQYIKYDEKDLIANIDYSFHLSIQTRANNKISFQIWKMLSNISKTIMELNKRYLADKYTDNLKHAFSYHDRILRDLKNRDLDMALENLHMHMQKGKETFLEIIKSVHSKPGNEILPGTGGQQV